MTKYADLRPGDPAPYFRQKTRANPRFNFDTVGGRYIVLAFLGDSRTDLAREMMGGAALRRGFFDDDRACFFGVTTDHHDDTTSLTEDSMPGVRFFFDDDFSVSRKYGASPDEEGAERPYRPMWVIIDPGLNIVATIPVENDKTHLQKLSVVLDRLPPRSHYLGLESHAPIIVVPKVIEPGLCDQLVDLYKEHGGEDSGFMREVGGKTVGMLDYSHKRRRDYVIEDEQLISTIQARFVRRVVPAVKKAHQFTITRMERYIVACYLAEERGHFRPHRDNTTKGTAHRRFAVTVNLVDDFDGGEISFPEFSDRKYRPPKGAALVFSCSLLHTVSPVIRGDRYAFLPFMYDDAAAKIRQDNLGFLANNDATSPEKVDQSS